MIQSRRYIVLAGGLIVVCSIAWLIRAGLLPSYTEIEMSINEAGIYAPIIFIAAYTVLTVLFVPATPLTLLGGAIFGPLFGVLYTVIGASLGATAAFICARFFRQLVLRGKLVTVSTQLAAFENRLEKNGFVTTLILRLIPLFPFNALNYGLGLTKISLWAYVTATVIGIIPGTFVYVYFGASLASLNPAAITLGIIGIVLLAVGGKYALQKYS